MRELSRHNIHPPQYLWYVGILFFLFDRFIIIAFWHIDISDNYFPAIRDISSRHVYWIFDLLHIVFLILLFFYFRSFKKWWPIYFLALSTVCNIVLNYMNIQNRMNGAVFETLWPIVKYTQFTVDMMFFLTVSLTKFLDRKFIRIYGLIGILLYLIRLLYWQEFINLDRNFYYFFDLGITNLSLAWVIIFAEEILTSKRDFVIDSE